MMVKSVSRIGAVALAALAIGVAGCSTPDRTTGQVISDHATAHNVKRALAKAPIFKYPDVKVSAYDGNIQLTGFVETEEQRTQAAQIAANVQGVRQVINEIMIKPTPAGRATIRDPLGRESGHIMLDTNAPPAPPLRVNPPPTEQPR